VSDGSLLFEPTSRYFPLKDLKYIIPGEGNSNNRVVTYKERRFIPSKAQIDVVQEVTVQAGQRLDNVAFHSVGDPEQYWRICDANEALHPIKLTAEPGKRLYIGIQRAT
jgi:hypothetical protein